MDLKTQIKTLSSEGVKQIDISKQLKCSKSSVSYHLKRIGIPQLFEIITDTELRNKYDWDKIQKYILLGNSYSKCFEKFGITLYRIHQARKCGIIKSRRLDINGNLIKDSSLRRGSIKRKLINDGILINQCALCGQQPKWQEKKLVLVLDHINGVNNDNRLENLRLLCPNCNSQTDTFSGRNTKRSRLVKLV